MEDVIPYLGQIARPGCKVIFLVHYSIESFDWFAGKPTPSIIKERKLLAKENAFGLEPLRERGVTVVLDIYTGPLRKIVKQYTRRGDIDLVMISARSRSWIRRLFQTCLLFVNLSCLSKSFSMFLLRPDISEREQ
jgi:hypothetical protein